LNRDLRVGPDSYAVQVIPALERRLGIHPSQEEWASVTTVGDLVSLAEAHVLRGQLALAP
jgi:acyl carrier protein